MTDGNVASVEAFIRHGSTLEREDIEGVAVVRPDAGEHADIDRVMERLGAETSFTGPGIEPFHRTVERKGLMGALADDVARHVEKRSEAAPPPTMSPETKELMRRNAPTGAGQFSLPTTDVPQTLRVPGDSCNGTMRVTLVDVQGDQALLTVEMVGIVESGDFMGRQQVFSEPKNLVLRKGSSFVAQAVIGPELPKVPA